MKKVEIDIDSLNEEEKQFFLNYEKKRKEHLRDVQRYYAKNKERIQKEKLEIYYKNKRQEYLFKLNNIKNSKIREKQLEKYNITFDGEKYV